MTEKTMSINKKVIMKFLIDKAIFFVLLVISIGIIMIDSSILSVNNLRNILSQASTRVIFALGVGTIIVTKGTDLSLGRQVGLAAVVSASLLQSVDYGYKMYPDLPELNIMIPIVLVMLITGFISFINGVVVSKFKVDPFVATLGMMTIVYGANSLYFDRPPFGAQPIGGLSESFKNFAQGDFMGIPYLVIYAFIIVIFMWFLWNKTKFGKNIFAIGGNIEAAKVSGVNVGFYLIMAYTLAGLLYGLGGAMEAARIGSATNNTGNMYELDAIAACIVGGLSFAGGIGSISGIVAGVLIFKVMEYGLTFVNVNTFYQFIIKGLIIIVAVAIDTRKHIKKK